ncbi:MAG TPA: hypothetical protein VIY08_15625 [Candidatus Nitrosocosmicus sp.]
MMIRKYELTCFLILFSLIVFLNIFYRLERVWADSAVATIPVGDGAYGVAYDPFNNFMNVTDGGSPIVSVIRPDNTVDTINVEGIPFGVAYDPVNNDMYVTNSNSNTVSVIASSFHLPIANAGSNQQVQISQTVNLDGSASTDPSGFTLLTYN